MRVIASTSILVYVSFIETSAVDHNVSIIETQGDL